MTDGPRSEMVVVTDDVIEDLRLALEVYDRFADDDAASDLAIAARRLYEQVTG